VGKPGGKTFCGGIGGKEMKEVPFKSKGKEEKNRGRAVEDAGAE